MNKRTGYHRGRGAPQSEATHVHRQQGNEKFLVKSGKIFRMGIMDEWRLCHGIKQKDLIPIEVWENRMNRGR